ncbi:MAG: NUDIX hydrolase [Candidatus Izemoplasmatales bacterium]|jgi:ADP-ribose pyrophosphatase YjhB (NUDIX family)
MIIEIFADGIDRAHIALQNRHISCRGIVIKNDKILGEYWQTTDVFNLPGGGVEPNETFAQCCAREITEETGVIVTVGDQTCVVMEYFANETWESHFFRCNVISEDVNRQTLTEAEKQANLTIKWYDIYEFLGILENYTSQNPYGDNIHQRELIGLLNSI